MRRRLGILLAAASLATISILPSPAKVALANSYGYVETGESTYTVNPDKAEIDVSVVIRFSNNKPPDSYYTYYWVKATAIVESSATNVSATSDAGAVGMSTNRTVGEFTEYLLTFPAVYYGQTRVITITYVIPAGPTSSGGFRASPAYFTVCGTTRGIDQGSLKIVAPAAFTASQIGGKPMTESDSNGSHVFDTGMLDTLSGDNSYWYGGCVHGVNASALTSSNASAGGASFAIQSWPGDSTWTTAVSSAVTKDVPKLLALTGLSVSGGPVTIQETGIDRIHPDWGGQGDVLLTGPGKTSVFDSKTRTLQISQDADEATVATGLARIWFNDGDLSDTWAAEGLAGYAGTSAAGSPCTGSAINLVPWTSLDDSSTAADLTTLESQEKAACHLISTLASDMGPANFKTLATAITKATNAYGIAGSTSALSDKDLLDLIDEVGMAPSGQAADVAQKLFSQYGVMNDSGLSGRSPARTAYTALEKSAGPWKLPPAVCSPMASWDFPSATSAMTTASQIISLRDQIETSVSGSKLDGGPIETQFEAAATQDDLDKVLKLVQDDADAAKTVASAQSLDKGGKNPLQMIGLIGGDPDGSVKTAIDDLDQAKASDARTAGQKAIDTINGSTLAGVIRLAIVIVLILVVMLVVFLVRRSRRPRPAFAAAAPMYPGMPGMAGWPGVPPTQGVPPDALPMAQGPAWAMPPAGGLTEAPPSDAPAAAPAAVETSPAGLVASVESVASVGVAPLDAPSGPAESTVPAAPPTPADSLDPSAPGGGPSANGSDSGS